jgi:hypothetical protein
MQIQGVLKAKALDKEHLITNRWWGIRSREGGDNRRQKIAWAIDVTGGTCGQIRMNSDSRTGLTTYSTRMTAAGRNGGWGSNFTHVISLSRSQNGDIFGSVSTGGPRQDERCRKQQAIAKGAFQINVAHSSATVKKPQSGRSPSTEETDRGITTATIFLC